MEQIKELLKNMIGNKKVDKLKKWTITDKKNYITVIYASNVFRYEYLLNKENNFPNIYEENVSIRDVLMIHRNMFMNIIRAPITLYNYLFHYEFESISVDEIKIKAFCKEYESTKEIEVKVACYTYTEMLEIYKNKYKKNYKLIGYNHSQLNGVGILVLCPRKKDR